MMFLRPKQWVTCPSAWDKRSGPLRKAFARGIRQPAFLPEREPRGPLFVPVAGAHRNPTACSSHAGSQDPLLSIQGALRGRPWASELASGFHLALDTGPLQPWLLATRRANTPCWASHLPSTNSSLCRLREAENCPCGLMSGAPSRRAGALGPRGKGCCEGDRWAAARWWVHPPAQVSCLSLTTSSYLSSEFRCCIYF